MVSVKDILTILDKIPVWKQLKDLPGKVKELEQRVASLESRSAKSADTCPKCKQDTFELVSTRAHPIFGDAGIQERLYRCSSCGFEEPKMQ